MVKDILGNGVTHDIYGNPLNKSKRIPVNTEQKELFYLDKEINVLSLTAESIFI